MSFPAERSDMYSSCIESSNSGAGMKVKNDFQKKSDTPKETLIKIPCSSNVNSQMMTDSKCSNAKIDPPSAARDSTADDDTGGGGDLQDSSALLSPARANYRSKSLPKSFMRGSHLKKSTGSRPTKLTNQMRAVSSPLVTEETFTFVTNESQIPENETLTVASSNESVLQKFKKSITQFRGKHSRKRNKCGECEAQLSKAMSKSEESRLMTKTDSEPEIFKENLSQSFPDSLTSLQEEEEKAPIYAEAVFAFQASDTQELALRKGDLIEVFVYDDCPWWWGRLMIPDPVPTMGSPATRDGWFPRDFVKVIPSVAVRSKKAESLAANPPQDPLGDTRARNGVTGDKPSITSQEYQMNFRDNAIRELLDAETAYTNQMRAVSSPLVTEETFTFVTNESQIPENETLTVASSNESVLQKFKKSITQFRGKHSRKRNKCGECEAQLSKAMSKSEESRLMTKTDSEPEIFKENLSQSFPDSLTSLQEEEEKAPIYAEAVFAFQASDTQELALRKGDLIEVFVYDDCPWWWGRLMIPDPVPTMGSPATRDGWFPRDFVKVIPSVAVRSKKAESLAANPPQDPLGDTRARNGVTGDKPSITSQEYQMNFRDNAIRELLDAETAYVNLLSSLCYGHQAAFSVYSTYCNSHPRGFMELEKYTGNKAACEILERCRKCEKLPELPLTAHLLAPIQRICRYPLHLSELVKYFPSNPNFQRDVKKNEDMMDCKESFELALGTMKKVAEMVNEEKRNSEHMSRIQTQFDNFTGPPLHFHSTRLFLQIDAIRLSPNLWNNTFTLFLFDRQIIYCRKDFMKRTHFIYKGRIFLDNCSILNLPDGKMFGVTLKNALRIYCDTRNKWHDFCFRSAAHKIRFLNTLSVERQYCGTSLFVSEFAGTADDDNITDDENLGVKKPPDGGDINRTEVVPPPGGGTTSNGQAKKPKPDVSHYDVPKKVIPMEEGGANRRHLGSWFRKPKSTNSTPFQSPTHRPPPVDGFGMQRNSMDGRSAPKNPDPSAKAS
uniref:Putative invasion-inducing protein n=1 Tax=Lutzomyia longipalpis TaxID=7200 RepID=A0A1B0CG38_LUTLO